MLYLFYALGAAAVVGLDQWVKALIVQHLALYETAPLLPKILHLTYVRNTGAAFSILSGQRWFLIAITVICVLAVAAALVRGKLPGIVNWSLVAILGGAVGNLIDRVRLGYVVDMFETEFIRFAVFNVADIFVVCGGILLAVGVLFFWKESPEHGTEG